MKYSSILEVYSLADLLEYNDISEEECLAFLVKEEFLELPDFQPLDYDD